MRIKLSTQKYQNMLNLVNRNRQFAFYSFCCFFDKISVAEEYLM